MSAESQSRLDPAGTLRDTISDCVHCGFCLPACPTYQLWGEEMDSPRGRIHLISQLLDGTAGSEAVAGHLDRCLGCMACVPACPSGVRYDQLIEAARSWAGPGEPAAGPPGAAPRPLPARSRRQRAARAVIFATFPYPARLRVLSVPLRAVQLTGLDRVLRSRQARLLLPELAAALDVAPRRVPRAGDLAAVLGPAARRDGRFRAGSRMVAARGERRATVGLLTGCVQQAYFPRVNAATAAVLAAEGCDVIIPAWRGCCGALPLHGGRTGQAAAFARSAITAFEAAGVDAVIINAAGCGSAMKDYPALFGGDPHWAERAAVLSAKVSDLSEFLVRLGPAAARHPLPLTAVYQDACHLAHAQGITAQPRELLQGIPGLQLVEIADAGTCCGSAGIYNLVQPAAAAELGRRKAAGVARSQAQLVVSANPGCMLQLASALAAQGARMPVLHVAEILDASIRALPAERVLAR